MPRFQHLVVHGGFSWKNFGWVDKMNDSYVFVSNLFDVTVIRIVWPKHLNNKEAWLFCFSSTLILMCVVLDFRLPGHDTFKTHSQSGHTHFWLAHGPLSQAAVPSGGVCKGECTGRGPMPRGGQQAHIHLCHLEYSVTLRDVFTVGLRE